MSGGSDPGGHGVARGSGSAAGPYEGGCYGGDLELSTVAHIDMAVEDVASEWAGRAPDEVHALRGLAHEQGSLSPTLGDLGGAAVRDGSYARPRNEPAARADLVGVLAVATVAFVLPSGHIG